MKQVTAEQIEAGCGAVERAVRMGWVSEDDVEAIYLAMSRASSPAPSGLVEAFDDACVARDEAGFLGTPAQCIRHLSAELAALQSTAPAPAQVGEASELKRWQDSIAHLSGLARMRAIDARFGSVSDADD